MNGEANTPPGAGESFAQSAERFNKFWFDLATKLASVGWTFSPGAPPPEAARQVRAALFKAMAESCDEFLRSPEFQATMKQSLDNAVQVRRQLNEWLGQLHHEFQGTSRQDVDQLMAVMQHLERRTADGFDRVSARLDDFGHRLEAMEKTKSGRAVRPKHRRKPARAG